MNIIIPDFNKLKKKYEKKKNQLIWTNVNSDLETPVSAYLKFCIKQKNSFLLESVHDGSLRGRYSVIGMNPDIIWKCIEKVAYTKNLNLKNKNFIKTKESPFKSLKDLVVKSKINFPASLPPMSSGLIGYLSYESIELYEKVPKRKTTELDLPDGFFVRPKVMAIFDNIKNILTIASPIWYIEDINFTQAYLNKQTLINDLIKQLKKNVIPKKTKIKLKLHKPKSNIKKKNFLKMVRKAKEFIYSGDIFQVVLSQKFKTSFLLPPFELYRALRNLNPSPFLFFLNFYDKKSGKFSLIGSSPEILVKQENEKVTIRPIAGTRPRGKSPTQDQFFKKELLSDPKELAEHLMLLDLGRNDVGRVSKDGTVKVTEQMKVEYYSHVMHIVSNVEGQVKNKKDIINTLMSGFPAGTVSGAPKIRAMEIINQLEPENRGPYAGCVGYFSANGNFETCIVLRTAIIKDDKMYVQAGAGIVADSKPHKEYEETINKAKALFKAAEQAYKEN